MTWVEFVLAIVKIAVVLGFCLNMSALATWAERRQSAMVQHRVGPNRAVIMVPSIVIQGILAAPGLLLGGLLGFFLSRRGSSRMMSEQIHVSLQLTVLVLWFSLMVLSWRVHRKGALNGLERVVGSALPRAYFFGGLFSHVVAFVVARLIPAEVRPTAAAFAGALLCAIMVGAGGYAAMRIPAGKVGIRLAGTLHALADTVKMIFKEDFVPPNADKLLHALGPIIAVFPALVVMAVIPFGGSVCFADVNRNGVFEFTDLANVVREMSRDGVCPGHAVSLQVVDLNVGILYLFAISSTGVIGATIAGWASDNKFSLLGGLRAASQMVSYEVAMGLSLMGLLLITETVRLGPIVEWQNDNAWGVFVQPFGFLMFLAAIMAETKRVPFDQPEGESEIVAGYFVEYSGFKWGMFMAGEYIEVITSSALLVTLFFGGYALPFLHQDGITLAFGENVLFRYEMNHLAVTILQAVAFFSKVILFSFVQIFFRWCLPRFRYDQLMKFGWTKLLPLAIVNLVITGIVVVAIDHAPAGFISTLKTAGHVTHAIVALVLVAIPVGIILLFLKPVNRQQFLASSSARFAAAAGGVKATPMQA